MTYSVFSLSFSALSAVSHTAGPLPLTSHFCDIWSFYFIPGWLNSALEICCCPPISFSSLAESIGLHWSTQLVFLMDNFFLVLSPVSLSCWKSLYSFLHTVNSNSVLKKCPWSFHFSHFILLVFYVIDQHKVLVSNVFFYLFLCFMLNC